MSEIVLIDNTQQSEDTETPVRNVASSAETVPYLQQTSTTQQKKNMNPAKEPGENKKHCEYCDVYLDDEFFTTHQGTKKHKRNLRKWKKKIEDADQDSNRSSPFALQALPLEESPIEDNESVQYRKKYTNYSDGTEKDTEEVNLLTALLCLRFAFEKTIEDFYISVFNTKWQPFGDIVVEIIKNGKVETNYAIKLKQIQKSKMKFGSFKNLSNIDKELEKVANLKNTKNFEKTKFIIFTRACVPEENKKHLKNGEEISDITEIKRLIAISKEEKTIFETQSDKGVKIILFTKQLVQLKQMQELFRKQFSDWLELSKVSREFKTNIEDWSNGDLGGTYALRKSDILLRIAQILLQNVILKPIPFKSNDASLECYKIWNDVVKEMDLTILKNNSYNICSVSNPINKTIEKMFKCSIKPNGFVQVEQSSIDELKADVKAHFFEEVKDLKNEISLSKIYMVLWKANNVPLIVTDRENCPDLVLNLISFLKQHGLKRSFIFLCNNVIDVTPKKELNIFRSLLDIRENPCMSQISIGITSTLNIKLEQISASNRGFFQWVTPEVFLNMSLKKCSFKGVRHKYFPQHEGGLQIILNDKELFEKIYQDNSERGGNVETKGKCIEYGHLRGLDPAMFKTNSKTI